MEKCECWGIRGVCRYTPNGYVKERIPICYGTKEREQCICNGDPERCDFYSDIRAKAQNNKINSINFYSPKTAKEWLELANNIAVGYDGYNSVVGLKGLIDEMREYINNAREILSKEER